MDTCRIGQGGTYPAEGGVYYGVLGGWEERPTSSAVPTVRPPHHTQPYRRSVLFGSRLEKGTLREPVAAHKCHTALIGVNSGPYRLTPLGGRNAEPRSTRLRNKIEKSAWCGTLFDDFKWTPLLSSQQVLIFTAALDLHRSS